MNFDFNVVWFIRGCGKARIVHTHSSLVAEELLEMLSHLKAMSGDIDSVHVDAVPEEVYINV